jgi:peroxiredoxin
MRQKYLLYTVLAAVLLIATPLVEAQAQAQRSSPVLAGESFPPGTYKNLNTQSGGPETIDLGASLGQRAVVLVYWIAGHARADEMLQEIQGMADALPADKAVVFGVATPQRGRGPVEIAKRLAELGVKIPVLNDENFAIGEQLRVQTVPNVSIIDKTGKLRMTNGASLVQAVGYEQTVRTAIERAVKTGEIGSYGHLDRYYPVNELVGKPSPDFKAPLLSTSVEQRMSGLIKKDAVNVLIFWSVNCPHCRKELPLINAWVRQNKEQLNVISAASITDDATRTRTKEFCDLNRFVFPTLVDRDGKISTLYQITATPTILFIGPDGVVDSVVLSAHENFGEVATRKKQELLGG